MSILIESTSETPETVASPTYATITVSATPIVTASICSTTSGTSRRMISLFENSTIDSPKLCNLKPHQKFYWIFARISSFRGGNQKREKDTESRSVKIPVFRDMTESLQLIRDSTTNSFPCRRSIRPSSARMWFPSPIGKAVVTVASLRGYCIPVSVTPRASPP